MAEGYERWWAPVLAPSALALLDRLHATVAAGATDLLDVGIGTGNLALPALERWPTARVTGIDASGEMVSAAHALADARLAPHARARLEARTAYADTLPFPDGTFDVAMSSFVLQLVPSRARALREIRRVLRPGGTLGYVTWVKDERPFAPDRVFDALLDEFGFDDAEGDGRAGDVRSVASAGAELRRAGFRDVHATGAELEYRFTVEWLHLVPRRVRRGDAVRGDAHGRTPALPGALSRAPDGVVGGRTDVPRPDRLRDRTTGRLIGDRPAETA